MSDSARLIAFYLPQYYPIPENDLWWGNGFTEWINVVRARPRFEGHYQPHLPADLGFYDLRVPESRQAQADLARAAGIHGFCYYHYWFNGKMLLERPFDEVLRTGEPDFPFCLCWANEEWRRNWDGHSGQVLVEQTYSEEDDLRHIQWLAAAFTDRRYIRVNGRPLMLIYRPLDLPAPQRTAETWRREARRLGAGDIYLCGVEAGGHAFDPRAAGFDASVENQPQWHFPDVRRLAGADMIYDYSDVIKHLLSRPSPDYKRFACLFPGWDNSARRKYLQSKIVHNSTPADYERWLSVLVARAAQYPSDERVIFINAWNEWGEGAHLEPDLRSGHAFLEATRRGLGLANGELHASQGAPVSELPVDPEAGSSIQLSYAEEVENLKAALAISVEKATRLQVQVDADRAQYLAFQQSRSGRLLQAIYKGRDTLAPGGTRRRALMERLLKRSFS